ncbi:hypothetical protein DFJ74DRAFT_690960 [Hyaloraphidium curvatum]|nr:hypothetical protein DFJ74DRAFT_690960 [Hyaloraphidium curvatum]
MSGLGGSPGGNSASKYTCCLANCLIAPSDAVRLRASASFTRSISPGSKSENPSSSSHCRRHARASSGGSGICGRSAHSSSSASRARSRRPARETSSSPSATSEGSPLRTTPIVAAAKEATTAARFFHGPCRVPIPPAIRGAHCASRPSAAATSTPATSSADPTASRAPGMRPVHETSKRYASSTFRLPIVSTVEARRRAATRARRAVE